MTADGGKNSLIFIKGYIFPITERETCLEFKADDFTGPYMYSSGASGYVNAISDFVEEQRNKEIDSLFRFVRLRTYHDESKIVFSLDFKKNLVEGLHHILPNPYLQIQGRVKASKRNIFPINVDKHFDLQEILTSFKATRTNEHNVQFTVERRTTSKETSYFEFDIIVGWSDGPKTPRKGAPSPSPSKLSAIQMSSPRTSLQNLFEEESAKDLVIVAGGGEEIKCHKIVFAAHGSPSLAAMLPSEGEKKESEPGIRIEMKDNSEVGIRHLLRYLYGLELTTAHITCEVAVELLTTADKYGLSHLRHSFSQLLLRRGVKWFTPQVILEVYLYAKDMNEREQLMTHALHIMTCMNMDDLRSCDGFKNLDPSEAIDLLCKLVKMLQHSPWKAGYH